MNSWDEWLDLRDRERKIPFPSCVVANTPCCGTTEVPDILRYGDFGGSGALNPIEAEYDPALTAIASLGKRVRGKPGLRVRLQGSTGNPTGIGAQLRLAFGQRLGPAREIHAGSGYWSQDSAVQVLATPQTPTEIQVRWPGGKLTTNAIPQGAKEILVGENQKN